MNPAQSEEGAGAAEGGMPLVSVIMPAYNAEAYIGEAIDSVLSQDYGALELIVIDDGSTDGTLGVVRSYGDRLTLLTQGNQGSAVARNTGLEAAKGEFVAFLDSDDIWLPGKLTAQVAYLQGHPEVGLVYARWKVWKPEDDGRYPPVREVIHALGLVIEDTGSAGIVADRSGWLYNRLLFTSLLHTITVLARRTLIDAVGRFDPELKRGQDYDYWIRASRITEIHQLDRTLALYRVHGEGCVKKWPNVDYERLVVEKALRQWGLEGPTGERTAEADVQRRLAEICFSFGYRHYWEGSPRLALAAFRQAMRHRPSLAALRYLVLSLGKVCLRPTRGAVPVPDTR